ncbi:MAG: redoxin domain-containing protein [Proteobacteria bacterium]|nr:redoxin domain-containing protein [Pseudomonadota bacterium]
MTLRYLNCALFTASLLVSFEVGAVEPPRYKPSSRSPEPIDLSANGYGGSLLAPDALVIGEKAPDFSLPVSGGGTFNLQSAADKGPVVIVFYRGHW